MAANSIKPIVCTADNRDDLSAMWDIAWILRGGEDALRAKPYAIYYGEPVSPLKYPVESVDKLLFCAEKSMPVIFSPAPIAGSTAPMTIAGHVAQGLAESFAGLVIHQLKAKGAPFIMGMGPAVLDMADRPVLLQCAGISSVLSGDHRDEPLLQPAQLGLRRHQRFADSRRAGHLRSRAFNLYAEMAGSNLNHDVGYLDFGLTGSLEMIVILNEIIDQVRRLYRGIPVDDETLAVDVIREVGADGNFLGHLHTLQHLESTQWRPKLISRMGNDKWQSSGSTSLLERAQQKLQQILADHQPIPIPAEQAVQIQKRVDRFK